MKLNLRHCYSLFDGEETEIVSGTSNASKADIIKAIGEVFAAPSYKAWLKISSNGTLYEMVKTEAGTVYLEEYFDSLGHSSSKAVKYCEALIDLNKLMLKEAA